MDDADCSIIQMYFFPVCFKIFDSDRDGVLNEAEVRVMVESMVEVRRQTAAAGYLLPDEGGVDQGRIV